jgi:hypothetical protein
MADRDQRFVGSIPEFYDTYLVPLISAGYAKDLAERTTALMPKDILETAAGTGEFACLVTEAAAAVFPADPPRFLARIPHGYHDIEVIRDELKKAGFSAVSISTVEKVSTAPSPRHAAIAFCQGSPLRNEIEARDAKLVDVVTDRAASAISQRYGIGVVSGNIRAHIVACSR